MEQKIHTVNQKALINYTYTATLLNLNSNNEHIIK